MKHAKLTMHNECVSFDYLISGDKLCDIAYSIVDSISDDFNHILDIYGVSEDELEDYDEEIYQSYTEANDKLEEFSRRSKEESFSEKDFEFTIYEENNAYEISKVYEGKEGLLNLIKEEDMYFDEEINLDVEEKRLAKLIDGYFKIHSDRM